MADILDYMAHKVKDATSVQLRSNHEAVSLVLFDDKDQPFAAASFTAEAWLLVVREIASKCQEMLRAQELESD